MRTQEGQIAISAAAIWVDRNVGEDWLIVDLRSVDEYRRGHLPGSVCVPWAEVAAHELRLRLYAGSRSIACIAPHDVAPEVARGGLEAMGLGPVRVLEGGSEAWAALGFPLDSSEDEGAPDPRLPFLAGGLILGGIVMGALVSPGFLMMSGLGWAVFGSRGARQAPSESPLALA